MPHSKIQVELLDCQDDNAIWNLPSKMEERQQSVSKILSKSEKFQNGVQETLNDSYFGRINCNQ